MSDKPPERYFYHSFPRRSDGENEIDKGLQILKSIVDSGLLLTPEFTYWQEPVSGGGLSKPVKNIQKRACFTELAPSELKEHSAVFGRFALEFDIQILRQLGAMPVFYFPRASTEEVGMESVGASLLCRTGEIQKLLNRFEKLAAHTKETPYKSQILDVRNNKTGEQQHTRTTIGGAQDLLMFLTNEIQPAWILAESLRALAGLFYPAEDLSYTNIMGYYRQREWRLVAGILNFGPNKTRKLSEEEIDCLLELDRDYFEKNEEYFTGTYRRVDKCEYFDEIDEINFIHYVRRVIVPGEALDDATNVLEGDGMPIVTTESKLAK